MKPSRHFEHSQKTHSDRIERNILYFQSLWENFQEWKTIGNMFFKNSVKACMHRTIFYYYIARTDKPHAPMCIIQYFIMDC